MKTAGAPEFWDAIVNGVTRVWEEKRPPYKTKSAKQSEFQRWLSMPQ